MSRAHLKVSNGGNGRYRISFESEKGKIVCEVSVSAAGQSGASSDEDKKQLALQRTKSLARALHEAI